MKYSILTLILLFNINFTMAQQKTVYDFELKKANGEPLVLSQFKGKKLLIVNTASKCGFTPQYTELQEIYVEYGDKLVVVGFPADEFGGQEPGSNEEIIQFCKKNFDVTFPLAEKSVVKGNGIHPLFEFLTTQENPNFTGDIKWNFEKFLIDENGLLIGRYRSSVKPDSDKIISKI